MTKSYEIQAYDEVLNMLKNILKTNTQLTDLQIDSKMQQAHADWLTSLHKTGGAVQDVGAELRSAVLSLMKEKYPAIY
jgi:hypothetical protein